MEELLNVPIEVFEELGDTGRKIHPSGEEWSESELPKMFLKIAKRVGA